MAWTASLQSISKDEARPMAVVLFTDNVQHKQLVSVDLTGLTADSFRARVESLRATLEASFTFTDTLDPATFDLTPKPTAPTQDELDQAAFMLAYSKWRSLSVAVKAGLLAADDKTFTDLLAVLMSTYKVSYILF